MFEVYTYFGRVISRHKIGNNETIHMACSAARAALLKYERETGQPAWVRVKR